MAPKPITENTLFYGDNLPILRECIPTIKGLLGGTAPIQMPPAWGTFKQAQQAKGSHPVQAELGTQS
jgi:hypothetical protein